MKNIEASRAGVKQSHGADYPYLSGQASYTRLGPIPEFTMPGGEAIKFYPANNYNIDLNVHHLLYDFGKRSVITDAAESNVSITSDNLEMVKSDLAYQTVQIFYSILFLQQNIAVLDSLIADLTQHILITQKKVIAAIDFDVLTTQVRVAMAKNARMDVINLLQKQMISLNQLLGIPSDTSLGLKGSFSVTPVSCNLDSLISQRLKQRYEFKRSKDAETLAGIRQRLASMSNVPLLNMNLSLGFKNGYIPDLNVLKGNWPGGFSVQVPIFDGYLLKYKVEEANAPRRSAQIHVTDTKNRIVSQVYRTVSDFRINKEKIQNSQLQVNQAEEALAIAKKQYEIGVISNLYLIDSETALAEMKLTHLRALYDYLISQYNLEKTVGNKIWQQ